MHYDAHQQAADVGLLENAEKAFSRENCPIFISEYSDFHDCLIDGKMRN